MIRHDKLLLLAALGAILLPPLAGCGNGGDDPDIIVAPIIETQVTRSCPPQADPSVLVQNVTAVGDIVNMDFVIQNLTGILDVDDIDLVLRYDATFMQVTSIRPETLFGNCGTVNPACNLVSPVCLNNLAAANAGGSKFCRSNGSTLCQTDADCPALNDACGSFGELELSFAVTVGPKTCSNQSTQPCLQSSDCQFCAANPAQTCQSGADCSGVCTSFVCVGGSFNGLPCGTSFDCLNDCSFGSCSGCPSVQVSGTTSRIVNLTVRVIDTGSSDLRLVVSSNPMARASALRKDTSNVSSADDFCPSVELNDPGNVVGTFTVTGTK